MEMEDKLRWLLQTVKDRLNDMPVKDVVSLAVDCEETIIDKCKQLPNDGEYCDCEDPHYYYYVVSFDKASKSIARAVCIKCGGDSP